MRFSLRSCRRAPANVNACLIRVWVSDSVKMIAGRDDLARLESSSKGRVWQGHGSCVGLGKFLKTFRNEPRTLDWDTVRQSWLDSPVLSNIASVNIREEGERVGIARWL